MIRTYFALLIPVTPVEVDTFAVHDSSGTILSLQLPPFVVRTG